MTTLWNHARAALLPALMGTALPAAALPAAALPAAALPAAALPGAVLLLSGCGGRASAPRSAASPTAQPRSAASPSAALPSERDSTPVASEGLDGVYLRTHGITVFDGEGWQPLEVEDCLRVRRVGANQLELEVQLVAANAHLCSIDGVASRLRGVEEIYELRPEPAEEPCQLQLVVETERLELVDVEHQCRRYYCGVRAGFDGVSFARTERRPARHSCAD